MKKISNKYFRNESSTEVIEVDYNLLRYDIHSKDGVERRLLGSYLDRIQEFLVRKGWVKVTVTTYNKIKDCYEK